MCIAIPVLIKLFNLFRSWFSHLQHGLLAPLTGRREKPTHGSHAEKLAGDHHRGCHPQSQRPHPQAHFASISSLMRETEIVGTMDSPLAQMDASTGRWSGGGWPSLLCLPEAALTQAPAACGRNGVPRLLRSQGSGVIWVPGLSLLSQFPKHSLSLSGPPLPSPASVTADPSAWSTPISLPLQDPPKASVNVQV